MNRDHSGGRLYRTRATARQVTRWRSVSIYSESPVQTLTTVLADLGLNRAVVGFEESYFQPDRGDEIRGALPDVRLVSCVDMDGRRAPDQNSR